MSNELKVEIGFGVGQEKNGALIHPAKVEEAMIQIRQRACQMFGGCTVVKTEGDWQSPAGVMCSEEGRTIFFFVNGVELPTTSDRIRELINLIKTLLNQEAVALSTIPCNTYIL